MAELTGYRKRVFETQCKFCEMYKERHHFAKCINRVYETYDTFLGEKNGSTGEWNFDSCFFACIWKERKELQRLADKTAKRYHLKNPEAKYHPEIKKYKVRT